MLLKFLHKRSSHVIINFSQNLSLSLDLLLRLISFGESTFILPLYSLFVKINASRYKPNLCTNFNHCLNTPPLRKGYNI